MALSGKARDLNLPGHVHLMQECELMLLAPKSQIWQISNCMDHAHLMQRKCELMVLNQKSQILNCLDHAHQMQECELMVPGKKKIICCLSQSTWTMLTRCRSVSWWFQVKITKSTSWSRTAWTTLTECELMVPGQKYQICFLLAWTTLTRCRSVSYGGREGQSTWFQI